MNRSRNPFTAFVLALLVVGVQYGSQVHALEHLSDELRRTTDLSLKAAPSDEVCAICALFAGGANAVASDIDDHALLAAVATIPQPTPASVATPAPSYYSSRAPPALL